MPNCPRCGQHNPENQRLCKLCGTSLARTIQHTPYQPTPEAGQHPHTPWPPSASSASASSASASSASASSASASSTSASSASSNSGGLGLSLAQVESKEELSMQLSARQQTQDPLIGQQIGNFQIGKRIGKGGFGTVYLAKHVFLEQLVAIKMLHMNQMSDPEVIERFRREAQALAQLRHDNIVHLTDFGLLDEHGFYLIMEYLEGRNLHQRLKVGEPFPIERLKLIFSQLCQVLDFVHRQGIVHRDLKPGNIFLIPDAAQHERVKLIDFGIAALSKDHESITHTGTYLGTAKYVSPEQAQGVRDLDPRSDLYSLAVILFRCLTGRVPFEGDSMINVIYKQIHDPVPTLQETLPQHKWSPALESFLKRALAKSRDERPHDAVAFWQQCEAALNAQANLEHGHYDQPTRALPIPPSIQTPHGQVPISDEHSSQSSWSSSIKNTDPAEADSFSIRNAQAFIAQGNTPPNVHDTSDALPASPIPPQHEEQESKRTLLFLLLGFGAVALSFLVVGAVVLFSDKSPKLIVPPQPTPPSPPTTSSPPPIPGTSTQSPTPPSLRTTDASSDGWRKLWLYSRPKGATIWRQNRYLGRTPLLLRGKAGEQVTLQLRSKGYKTRTIQWRFTAHPEQRQSYTLQHVTIRTPKRRTTRRLRRRRRIRRRRRRRRSWRRRRVAPPRRRPTNSNDPFGKVKDPFK